MSIFDIQMLFREIHKMLTRGNEPDDEYFKLEMLDSARVYPIWLKCATLAWHKMNVALHVSKIAVKTE